MLNFYKILHRTLNKSLYIFLMPFILHHSLNIVPHILILNIQAQSTAWLLLSSFYQIQCNNRRNIFLTFLSVCLQNNTFWLSFKGIMQKKCILQFTYFIQWRQVLLKKTAILPKWLTWKSWSNPSPTEITFSRPFSVVNNNVSVVLKVC